MALAEPEEWLKHLITCHDRQLADLRALNAYYEGDQPLAYMAPELMQELEDRIRQVVINWPQLVVDSLEERLDVEGFRVAGQAEDDKRLWEWWQANDLDTESQLGHLDALVMRRAFVIVGTAGEREHDENADDLDDDIPLITVESPLEVHAERDPRTREGAAALKRWKDEDGSKPVEHATVYLPDVTVWYDKVAGKWKEVDRDEHGLGRLPVEPLVNRARLRNRSGVSELKVIIPLSDAACKSATDMMVSAEYHAIPRRVAYGFDESDFQDEAGNPVSALSRMAGRVWATEKSKLEGADIVQFPEASLTNFHNTINALAALVASLSGLPPHFLGLTTDNPASADAIRSSETRLIKRAERRQRGFGGTWERVQRIGDRIITGEWSADLRRLETRWRDASTPTVAQKADAAVKKFTAGIVPLRQTRVDLGYTDTEIRLMEEADEAEDPLGKPAPNPAGAVGPKPAEPEQPAPEAEDEPAGESVA